MTRIILRLLNAPGLVLLTALGLAIQTSLFAWKPATYLQPDIILLVVIFLAFRREFFEGGVLTLIVGNLAEIHSAAPRGFFLILYMSVYLGMRMAGKILVIPGVSSWMFLTLVASVASKLEGLALMYMLGAWGSQWKHTVYLLFPGAVVAAVTGYFVYRGLDRFDQLTYKHAREDALDDELQVIGESG